MCLGTLSVLYPLNSLFFKVFKVFCCFLLNSMVLMVEISNSWVHGLPREKTFISFLVWNPLIFEPSTLEKDTKKLPMSVDQ